MIPQKPEIVKCRDAFIHYKGGRFIAFLTVNTLFKNVSRLARAPLSRSHDRMCNTGFWIHCIVFVIFLCWFGFCFLFVHNCLQYIVDLFTIFTLKNHFYIMRNTESRLAFNWPLCQKCTNSGLVFLHIGKLHKLFLWVLFFDSFSCIFAHLSTCF